ncbi:MAG: hypothetical protein Q4D42_06620 [Eubacteriales bacterium]|nr:hypothetical protein [Eubacteriales bacterium]
MKRNNWRNAGCLTTIAAVVAVFLLMGCAFRGLSGRAAMIVIWLPMLVPTVFFLVWAFKNESRKSGILQAIGIVLIFVGFTFLWFALWNPQATWTFPISLPMVSVIYVTVIVLCFVFATPPGRK